MNYKKFSLALLFAFSAVTASHASINSVLDSINQKVSVLSKVRATLASLVQTTADILGIVTEINQKQKCDREIHASDIGTTGYVITEPGTYCLVDDVEFNPAPFPNAPTVTFTGGGGSGAAASAIVSGISGQVVGFYITSGGTGYTSAPTVTITGGGGSGATATAVVSGGVVTLINVGSAGSGYTNTVQAAITIASSNVNLMLNNHRLAQAGVNLDGSVSSSQTPFVVGILVPDVRPTDTSITAGEGLDSIYISGDQAIIDGFSMYGIRIFGHTTDIQLSNITIKNCGKLASAASRPNPNYFPHDFTNILAPFAITTPSFGVAGLAIGEDAILGMGPTFFQVIPYGNRDNQVRFITLDNIYCLENLFNGFYLGNAENITMNNCHLDGNFSDDPGMLAFGMLGSGGNAPTDYPAINNLVVANSTFNDTRMTGTGAFISFYNSPIFGGTVRGASFSKSQNLYFTDCHFDNTLCEYINGGASGHQSSACDDVTFINCTFDGTQSLGSAQGFHMSGASPFGLPTRSARNLQLINCTARNTQEIGDREATPAVRSRFAVGFVFLFSKNVYLENCIASDIIMNGPAAPDVRIAGFYLESGLITEPEFETRNFVFKGCVAARVLARQAGSAQGFLMLNLDPTGNGNIRTVSLEDCIAEGCESLVPTFTTLGLAQGTARGFVFADLFSASEFPVSYTNCKALRNKGIATSAIETPGVGVPTYSAGFYEFGVVPGFPVQKHNYYNCEAIDNVYGFLLQNCTQCVVRNCRSDSNVQSGVGEGFTDLGSIGIPAAPGQSTSLFEANRAFNNGVGTIPFGTNANYNVRYVAPTDWVPTLTGSIASAAGGEGGYYFPQHPTYAPAHNISIVR